MAAVGTGARMPSIFIFNRGDDDSEEELQLGQPDESEAKDLARHVDRCATRYRLFTKRLRSQGTQVKRIEVILYLIAFYACVSVGPVHDFVVSFLSAAVLHGH